jgi:NADH-quinone oxidoreductase subunit L
MTEGLENLLPVLLGAAWLIPLASFVIILFTGPRLGRAGVLAGYLATGAILSSFVLSLTSLVLWLGVHPPATPAVHGGAHHAHAAPAATVHLAAYQDEVLPLNPEAPADEQGTAEHGTTEHEDPEHAAVPSHYSGTWYSLAIFGPLVLEIGYYIDALTVCMFTMVTLIATCIHFFATGYMHDELHEVTDHEVTLANGHHLHRPGRFYRFFQYLSLFCFSMLGLVIAGNVFMVFVFWELVGVCSYFLIGFYIERKSASTAANKAFIVNRVGDFGMIIGLMALWGSLGTLNFADTKTDSGIRPGVFSLVRPAELEHTQTIPDGMVKAAAADQIARGVAPTPEQIHKWRSEKLGYGLLIVAGLGIFCGCVGKSAQFPLHVWLPDAMEGPTPVSALVHSATMVAAGVYLVGRFYPVFTPEVLLVIAYIGAITLFIAATIAITATDIKRVLAYSTISQLGYMMLGLGVGAWLAGILHLFTHAFFKSLLFLCSGSVIHAVHTNDMRQMGGLRKKMPYTAYTMLVGCMAIAGFGIPFIGAGIGFSGFYSKDAIIAQLAAFRNANDGSLNGFHAWLYYAAAGGAAITAFYMFRLWYMTFGGEPRDHHKYDHAHESPPVMYVPLLVLAAFAICVAWTLPFTNFSLANVLEQARPAGTLGPGLVWNTLIHPLEHESHHGAAHVEASIVAITTALFGFFLATAFYSWRVLNPEDVRQQFPRLYSFLWHKWWFDELYDVLFVRPVFVISQAIANFDKKVIDRFIDFLAASVRRVATFDDAIDRYLVDGTINVVADWIYAIGVALRGVQTGRLREYVVFIVVATVVIFVMASFALRYALAG